MNQITLKNQQKNDKGKTLNLSGVKAFDFVKGNFINFDELIQHSSSELNIEYELFFSNSLGTQWGYMKVINGKPVKTIPLLEINIISVTKVNPDGLNFQGVAVKYSQSVMNYNADTYIPFDAIQKCRLISHFSLPAPISQKNEELCNKLLKNLIVSKANDSTGAVKNIYYGAMQGWNKFPGNRTIFVARNCYPEVLHPILPKSVVMREKPALLFCESERRKECDAYFERIFGDETCLKTLYLLRIASYTLSITQKDKADFDQIIVVNPSETVTANVIEAFVKNDSFSSRETVTLGGSAKKLVNNQSILNDAVLVVTDETKADETNRRIANIQRLESNLVSGNNSNCSIPVVISKYAGSQFNSELCCKLNIGNFPFSPEIIYIKRFLEHNDAEYIQRIENDFGNYKKRFALTFSIISISVPKSIPEHRHSVYIILATAARVYDEFFDYFFGEKVEKFIADWLSDYNEDYNSSDDNLLKDFGICLNAEISSGRFNFIKRSKYIVFDKKTDTIIVDDDNLYIETEIIKSLAESRLHLHSVNYLTEMLKRNDCLTINDRNSKCYRFHVQNSYGEPYMLYTYGFSKKLINSEIRKKLGIAGMQKFLLSFSELEQKNLLPLGTAADNSFVGKDISYGSKSNDHIFITGQSGKGKTFYATNLLPSLAMLGSRMCVLDVSGSFTRDEVLRALPQDVVDGFFEFIEVDVNKHKLPINPLYIGDCIGLPAKKRRVVSFIKAIAGKLDKAETKIVTGLISEILKKNDGIITVNTDMLLGALKRGGPIGYKVSGLISSALDDIERIGYDAEDWSTFFKKSKKIPVISLVNESGDNVHSMLDVLISSVFEWQKENNTAPLTIVVDEIKDQNFAEGSPLHTILTQGRKFNTKLIGMTQQYISQGNHSVNVIKEAGIKVFFRPSKSLDRIAIELGYKSPADAGFGSMGIGDCIISCDLFNKADEVNEYAVMHCKTVNFTETPLYQRFIHSD